MRSLTLRIIGGLIGFASWWIDELLSVLPVSWRRKLMPPDDRPTLTVSSEVMMLAQGDPTVDEELILWRQPVMPTGGMEVGDLTAAVGDRPAHIRFDAGLGLSRQIALPVMSRADTGSAVLLQVEQLFPFREEDVHIAYGIRAAPTASNQATVAVSVIERPVIDHWLETLQSAGIQAASFGILCDSTQLSFHRPPARLNHRARNLRVILVGTACLAFVALLSAWHGQRSAYIDFLEQSVEDRKAVAIEARKLSDRIAELTTTRRWFDAEVARPDLGAVLEALSANMPDTAWAEQLDWRGRQLRIQGYAADSVALPKQIAATGIFENVQFRAAMSNRGDNAKERFDLTADVKGLP